MKTILIFAVALVSSAAFITMNLAGQQQAGKQTTVQESEIIDGSKDSSRIPDEIAWWMLFQVLADRPRVPYEARASMLLAAGLTQEQADAVIQTANVTVAEVRRMEMETGDTAGGLDPEARSSLLRQSRDGIVRNAASGLLARRDAKVAEKVQTFVNSSVKRGIKMTAGK